MFNRFHSLPSFQDYPSLVVRTQSVRSQTNLRLWNTNTQIIYATQMQAIMTQIELN